MRKYENACLFLTKDERFWFDEDLDFRDQMARFKKSRKQSMTDQLLQIGDAKDIEVKEQDLDKESDASDGSSSMGSNSKDEAGRPTVCPIIQKISKGDDDYYLNSVFKSSFNS